MKFIKDPLVFFLASATTFSLVYFKLAISDLQKGVSILLLLLLLLYNYLKGKKRPSFLSKILNTFFIYASAVFVQLLVVSAGGFYSPFLILLHLYTLGISFLLSLSGSISFLIFSMVVLLTNILVDPNLSKLFHDDPGTVLLYLASFSVIIPLSVVLSRHYHLKETLVSLLNREFELSTSRQESVFRGIHELVIVTDQDLLIVSMNESTQKLLQVDVASSIHKPLLKVLPIFNQNDQIVSETNLQIVNVLTDKATRIIRGLYIKPAGQMVPAQVIIQISPVMDQQGQVNQLVLVISDATDLSGKHSNLDTAYLKNRELIDNLRQGLIKAKLAPFLAQVDLFAKSEDDLLTALELEDHPIQVHFLFRDLAELCKQVINSKMAYASDLGVKVEFALPENDAAEWALLKLKEDSTAQSLVAESSFAVPIDVRWFKILVEKLLDLAVLLSSSHPNGHVKLMLDRNSSPGMVIISVVTDFWMADLITLKIDILKEYYGKLSLQTNLNHGTGLEGFIIKAITEQLKIPLSIEANRELVQTTFKITLGQQVTRDIG